MSENKIFTYYERLKQWMNYFGFSEITVHAESGCDVVFKRSRTEFSKFGKVDTYCCVKYMKENAIGQELQHFSQKMYELSSRHRTGAPLGFGAMMVVYPLLITENINLELSQFVKTYCPKHFAAAEFPSVLDLATGYVYYYERTPIWGYAYYASYRRESYELFSPHAWNKINEQQNQSKI